jgi:hypothetical protein
VGNERVQFVDSIVETATVRLSLTTAPWRVLFVGTDVSPPQLRRATVSTMLADGALIPAVAYDNRVVRLHLQLDDKTPAAAATALQALRRELDRPSNILRWQPEPTLSPVYFKTFRSPDTVDAIDHGINLFDFTCEIPAEPFSLGHRVDVTPVAVSNDPNAGASGRFMDITAPQGDTETPLRISVTGSAVASRQGLFAMRRRGTVSSLPLFTQCETLTQGTDTSVTGATDGTGGGASPSGAGSNSSATTFATNTLTPVRLSTTAFPTTPSVDVRGTYRVFVRVRPATAGGIFQIKLEHGIRAIQNATVTTTVTTTTYTMVDLGLVQIPEGIDPITDGPGGATLAVVGIPIKLYAQRTGGSGNLNWDCLYFIPADDRLCLVSWGSTAPTSFVLDGISRTIYGIDGSGRIADIGQTAFSGDFPSITPGITNRLVYINDTTPNPGSSDAVSTSVTLTASYWPRYLSVRPVGT